MSRRVLLADRAWPDSFVEQRELAAVGAELIEAIARRIPVHSRSAPSRVSNRCNTRRSVLFA